MTISMDCYLSVLKPRLISHRTDEVRIVEHRTLDSIKAGGVVGVMKWSDGSILWPQLWPQVFSCDDEMINSLTFDDRESLA